MWLSQTMRTTSKCARSTSKKWSKRTQSGLRRISTLQRINPLNSNNAQLNNFLNMKSLWSLFRSCWMFSLGYLRRRSMDLGTTLIWLRKNMRILNLQIRIKFSAIWFWTSSRNTILSHWKIFMWSLELGKGFYLRPSPSHSTTGWANTSFCKCRVEETKLTCSTERTLTFSDSEAMSVILPSPKQRPSW